jgi:AcrR family transcriptional regulator
MTQNTQELDFSLKKRPSQERSRATFEAIVTACTWLLPERGFDGVTTNHIAERAGVNISSLYEYFPGKDAIVAQVAERMVQRVLDRLQENLAGILEGSPDDAVRRWIELIYRTIARERTLVAVFRHQVPYTNELPSVRAIGPRLLEFSQYVRGVAGGFVHPDFSNATLHLLINLVSSTILQLVLDPPDDVTRKQLLDELCRRVEGWVRAPAR